MKTKNNNQETFKNQVRKMVLSVSALLVSFVLISWTVNAQDFWMQVLNNGTNESLMSLKIDRPSDTKTIATEADSNTTETGNEAVVAESALQIEEYNAAKYAEAEITAEIESWMNGNAENGNEAVEVELVFQVEKFDAAKYVEAEMATEIENWMNGNAEINHDAVFTESVFQMEGYNADKYVEAETTDEIETWMNGSMDSSNEVIIAESALQIERYNADKYVAADLVIETESWITEKEFIKAAENITANGTATEIQKYARKQIELQNKIRE